MTDDERFEKAYQGALAVAARKPGQPKTKRTPYFQRTPWFMLHMDKKYRGTDHPQYLAKAEVEAERQGWTFEWHKMPDGSYTCTLFVGRGKNRGEGIDMEHISSAKAENPDQRRLIEAELALQFADW